MNDYMESSVMGTIMSANLTVYGEVVNGYSHITSFDESDQGSRWFDTW